MEEQVKTTEKLSLGAVITAELMIGFWFGIGIILVAKMVLNIKEPISEK